MALYFELLEKLRQYLAGKSSDRDLEVWLVAHLQRILDSGDGTAIGLANEIDAAIVEVGEGIIHRATLYSRLYALVHNTPTLKFEFAEAAVAVTSGRNDVTGTNDTVSVDISHMLIPVRDLRVAHQFV